MLNPIFQVIVNISEKSHELFKIAADMNYIHVMVSELQSVDVLYQLNILQLLSRIAVTPHGLNYLVKNGLLQSIADLIRDIQTKPLGSLLVPGNVLIAIQRVPEDVCYPETFIEVAISSRNNSQNGQPLGNKCRMALHSMERCLNGHRKLVDGGGSRHSMDEAYGHQ